MPVPLIDLSSQHVRLMPQFELAFRESVETNRFVLGPGVEAFEKALSSYCGSDHVIGLSSGTDALIVALMVLGIGVGDEVVTSSFSFFATAGSISRVGAVPVFVDIEPDTFNLDPGKIELAITSKTKAIMPVHLFGQCVGMKEILAIGVQHGLPVIEDAAQAIGARDGQVDGVGSAGAYGEIGCLSFYPTKNLSAFGDGGACLTNDAELAAKIRSVRQHGESSRYQHEVVGGNFRLDAIQAAMLSIKLPHLNGWVDERRAIAGRYYEWLADVGGITLPVVRSGADHVFNQYTLRVGGGKRDALARYLSDRNIGCKVYYPLALHQQPCFAGCGQADKALPMTAEATGCVLSIPIYPGLSESEQREVADAIREFSEIS